MGRQPATDSVAISNFSDAFFDTSVLYTYTLDQDSGSAEEVLSKGSCESIVSKSVKGEYDNVQTRRERAIKSIRKAVAKGTFGSWSVPDSLDLSPSDESWCEDLVDDLRQISTDEEIKNRLKIEKRRFKTGQRVLFTRSDSMISDVVNYPRSPSLNGQLQLVMNHSDDRQIICDAAAWSANGGTGNFVTSDREHMLSNRDDIMDKVSRDRASEPIEMASPTEFLAVFP